MKQILIFGAGRSSISMLAYLAEKASDYNWHIKVVDTKKSSFLDDFAISFEKLDVTMNKITCMEVLDHSKYFLFEIFKKPTDRIL